MLQNDAWNADIGLQQLTPWGGIVNFGLSRLATTRPTAPSSTSTPPTADLFFAVSQPLLRNFGRLPTEINIETSRNTRDASYQTFIRSVQAVINSVEQSYWDLVYARGTSS